MKLKFDFFFWGDVEGISVVIFVVIGVFIFVSVLVVFYKYCNIVVVKVFNREFLFVYLGCIVVIFVLLLVMIGKLIVVGCIVFLFFFVIFLIFCIFIMLLKIDRFLCIF